MSNDVTEGALATWAAKNLPARLDVTATAKLLGFGEQDIQILMGVRKLTPLGDPAQNAPKWFSAVEMIQLAADKDWLHKATKEVSKYWRHKRERRSILARKVSPDSSPEVPPEGEISGSDRAMAGDEKIFSKAA